ncbi:hypothetical protein [Photobacterium salinisoli]|uniref:hypothetical protein n=1 Tax=Photobacterium salinisoli TaxID=1616783 RepID=UPI000EA0C2D0|nr:hypothetical protein [Photobacterium salinisoli]
MSLWDNFGESLGGVWDSVSSGAGQIFDAVVDSEVDRVKSADPASNRPKTDAAQQPGGQPIPTQSQGFVVDNKTLMIGGGIAAVLLIGLVAVMGRR